MENGRKSCCELLSPHNVKHLFDSVDAFLFDCDGVIWKGDTLIDGVQQTLDMLRSKGKKLVFVTNNSTKSRAKYAKKFLSLGIAVSEDEIFSSSFAAAMFLKVNDFPREKKVYVIGEEGILEELELAGFTALGGPVLLASAMALPSKGDRFMAQLLAKSSPIAIFIPLPLRSSVIFFVLLPTLS